MLWVVIPVVEIIPSPLREGFERFRVAALKHSNVVEDVLVWVVHNVVHAKPKLLEQQRLHHDQVFSPLHCQLSKERQRARVREAEECGCVSVVVVAE